MLRDPFRFPKLCGYFGPNSTVDNPSPHLVHYLQSLWKKLNGRFVCLFGQRTAGTNEVTWHAKQANIINPPGTGRSQGIPARRRRSPSQEDQVREIRRDCGDPHAAGRRSKHADQMVRGTVVMPNGLGKSRRCWSSRGDKQREAAEAGADFVGGDDMVNKIQTEGWTDSTR